MGLLVLVMPAFLLASSIESVLQQAKQKEAAGDYEGAASLYEGVLVSHPDHKDALLGLARNEYWQGRYKEAIATYEKLLKIYPNDVGGLVGIGKCYLALGEQRKAGEYFRRAQEIEPKEEEVQALEPAMEEKTHIDLDGVFVIEDLNYESESLEEYQELRYFKEGRYGIGLHSGYWRRFRKEAFTSGLLGHYYIFPRTKVEGAAFFAPGAQVTSRQKYKVELTHTLWKKLTLGAAYEFADWKQANTHLVSPSLGYQIFKPLQVKTWYELQIVPVEGEDPKRHSIFGELEAHGAPWFQAHAGYGRLSRNFEGGRTNPIFQYQADKIFGGVGFTIMGSLLVRFDVSWEKRNNSEEAMTYLIGFGYRY